MLPWRLNLRVLNSPKNKVSTVHCPGGKEKSWTSHIRSITTYTFLFSSFFLICWRLTAQIPAVVYKSSCVLSWLLSAAPVVDIWNWWMTLANISALHLCRPVVGSQKSSNRLEKEKMIWYSFHHLLLLHGDPVMGNSKHKISQLWLCCCCCYENIITHHWKRAEL